MYRFYMVTLVIFILSLSVTGTSAWGWSDTRWTVCLESRVSFGAEVGAQPGSGDGYDGQTAENITGLAGVFILHYRQQSESWVGPSGFYRKDYESPIPRGGSKTWSDIYLWAWDYPVSGNLIECCVGPDCGPIPPGYVARLDIAYTPESLNWTGPMQYDIDLPGGRWIELPVPTTNDPYNPMNVTRLTFTVYAVPEPSSLLALGAGLVPLAVGLTRRGRRMKTPIPALSKAWWRMR